MIITDLAPFKEEISENGFTVIPNVFTHIEIDSIINLISRADSEKPSFRKTAGLFAIRQFFKELPDVRSIVFNDRLKAIIHEIFGSHFFIVKSIYFDKPGESNWFVSYHQDLTISVMKKFEIDGFGPWTVKQNHFAVQPPISILENNLTIRIHLDNTDDQNGALRVIEKSHLKGIYRPETIDWNKETEVKCNVPKGGIMIMKPLLLHASSRTTNHQQRRVIHIEFSQKELPVPLKWAELIE
jgi:ectoine hydroxylase-related dioxygenase (phytanoyl-CoA dioxygenase family)